MKTAAAILFSLCVSSALFADPVRFYETGQAFQASENWYSAIESYQEALRENPSYAPVLHGLSECFYALGEYEQALQQVRKAAQFRRNDPILMNLEGRILIGLGQLEEAQQVFSAVLTTWPNDVEARFGVAEIDVAAGRVSAASSRYQDALKRQGDNRKALLSLALVSWELGNTAIARDYIEKALQHHGDNPQVYYFAAYISSLEGKNTEAEARLRAALRLKGEYDEASELLSTILFRTGRYSEVIELCNERIRVNRNRRSAWYMLALSLAKLGRHEEAISASRSGLQIDPNDEVFRTFLEQIIIERLALEDNRRVNWAAWHSEKARAFSSRNLSDQALYEYRQALKINPYGTEDRLAYAALLLNRGYPARYVEQLKFIQSLGKSNVRINDAIESYQKLLQSSVQSRWKVDTLYLDKAHTALGVYFQSDSANIQHPESERITSAMLSEVLSWNPRLRLQAADRPVASYSEAFRTSRLNGEDYFVLVRYRENERDVEIRMDLYVSKTGSKADTFTVFRTGNDRYANALRRSAQVLSAAIPVQGVLLQKFQQDGLMDLGRSDSVAVGAVFDILPAAAVTVANEGIGLLYRQSDILGTFTVTEVDEDVSVGTLSRSGFFDRINGGDKLILKASVAAGSEAVTDTNAAAQPRARIDTPSPPPALLGILRKIR